MNGKEAFAMTMKTVMEAPIAPLQKIDDSNVDDWARQLVRIAQMNLEEHGELRPVLFLLVPGEEDDLTMMITIDLVPFTSLGPYGKDVLAWAMPKVMKTLNVYARQQIMETWFMKSESEDESEEVMRKREEVGGDLENVPGRKEALHATLETCTGRSWTWMAEIDRDPEGKPFLLEPELEPESEQPTSSEGRFVGWFGPQENEGVH